MERLLRCKEEKWGRGDGITNIKKGTLAFAKNKPEALASWLQVNQQIH